MHLLPFCFITLMSWIQSRELCEVFQIVGGLFEGSFKRIEPLLDFAYKDAIERNIYNLGRNLGYKRLFL